VPLSQIDGPERTREQDEVTVRRLLAGYQTTLLHENHPIAEFEFLDMARKVVGVGSVGTRAWIILLRGRDNSDPLFLQAKQAEASVVEKFLSPGQYSDQGERVVRGQRLMQASSDIFLGWQPVEGFDGIVRYFYLRQLQDWKGSVNVDEMGPEVARLYARICGETLARAHARSGDRVAIAAYLGSGDQFDEALERFGQVYADQNEQDYAAFCSAIGSGRLSTMPSV
jgi:uncharacterized protein (DUF2252 family)